MRLTKKMLLEKNACHPAVETFAKEWPDGCDVNRKNVLRASELMLDLDWFASKFLTAPARAEYEKARDSAFAEYEKAKDSAFAEYKKADASAFAEYKKAEAPARAEYGKVRAPAWAEYKKAEASAWAKYKKAKASALAENFQQS